MNHFPVLVPAYHIYGGPECRVMGDSVRVSKSVLSVENFAVPVALQSIR